MSKCIRYRLIKYEAKDKASILKQFEGSLKQGKYPYLTTITVMDIDSRMLSANVINRIGAITYKKEGE